VATVKKSKLAEARAAALEAGGQLLEIGRATSDRGRVELSVGGRRKPVRDEGWTHLR